MTRFLLSQQDEWFINRSLISKIWTPSKKSLNEIDRKQNYFLRTNITFSNDEATKIAEHLSLWFGMFAKRSSRSVPGSPEDYLLYIFELFEHSMLTVKVLMFVLKEFLENSKSVPSIAEINEFLNELSFASRQLHSEIRDIKRRYQRCKNKLTKALQNDLPKVRKLITDFPEADEFTEAFKRATGNILGEFGDIKTSERLTEIAVANISKVEVWPIVPFYLTWLKSFIPSSHHSAAFELLDQLAAEDGQEGAIYSPRLWWNMISCLNSQSEHSDFDEEIYWDVFDNPDTKNIEAIETMMMREFGKLPAALNTEETKPALSNYETAKQDSTPENLVLDKQISQAPKSLEDFILAAKKSH